MAANAGMLIGTCINAKIANIAVVGSAFTKARQLKAPRLTVWAMISTGKKGETSSVFGKRK